MSSSASGGSGIGAGTPPRVHGIQGSERTQDRKGIPMHRIICCMSCMWLVIASTAFAEFYKYIDADGNVRYTDDYTQIPQAQRRDLKTYMESAPKPESGPEGALKDSPAPKQPPSEVKKETDPSGLSELRERLETERDALREQYDAMMKEKAALEIEREKKPRTLKATEEYNKKAAELNERIVQYEIQLNAHNQKVEQYNRRVGETSQGLKHPSEASKK